MKTLKIKDMLHFLLISEYMNI